MDSLSQSPVATQWLERVRASHLSLSSLSLAVAALAGYHLWLRTSEDADQYIASPVLPPDLRWLDKQTFEVFTALCDAVVPAYSVRECTPERVRAALAALHPDLRSSEALHFLRNLDHYVNYLCAGAVQHGVHRLCAQALQRTSTKREQRVLFFVLKLLSTSVGTLLLTGYPAPFQKLPLFARERALRNFRDSSLDSKKQFFLTFKRLVASTFLSFTDENSNINPFWSAIEYNPRTAIRSLDSLLDSDEHSSTAQLRSKVNYRAVIRDLAGVLSTESTEPDEVSVDVVVVGSGCGGGVVAHELVRAGYTVLVLEKGGLFQAEDFARWGEGEALTHSYERGGLCTTADGGVTVLAGSCVGGGSTVNWSASFSTPRHVLEQWDELGLPQFDPDTGAILNSLKTVRELLHVNTDCSHYEEDEKKGETFVVNENNRLLWQGAKSLGYIPEKIPRNVKNCVDCGHCSYGCSHESKQSTWTALLEPLLLEQIKEEAHAGFSPSRSPSKSKGGKLYVIPDCHVDSVTFTDESKTVASGAIATAAIYAEHVPAQRLHKQLITTRKLLVSAKVVVSSAGSLHTPALLLRSQLTHPLIGKYLSLHPVLGCGGIVDKNTNLANGVSMGVVVKHPTICTTDCPSDRARFDAEMHPVIIETPPLHMAILGLLLPWHDGLLLKSTALGWKQFGAFIDICRDHPRIENRVEIDAEGNPLLHYRLPEEDAPNLLEGLEVALRMLRSVGAKALFYGHSHAPWFVSSENDDDKFEAFVRDMKRGGVQPLEMQIFSAHQLSSCRMASDTSLGPVSPSGALFDCENLFVADGSVLPTAIGVNPMITIDAVAHLIAQNIVTALERL